MRNLRGDAGAVFDGALRDDLGCGAARKKLWAAVHLRVAAGGLVGDGSLNLFRGNPQHVIGFPFGFPLKPRKRGTLKQFGYKFRRLHQLIGG